MPTNIRFDGGAPLPCAFDELSPWSPWTLRATLKEAKWGYPIATYPGVYLLARFSAAPPPGAADYLDGGIVYMGEARNLGVRWRQFENSAFLAKPGHSGGWAYRLAYATDPHDLYVAALPIWFGNDVHVSTEDWTQSYRLYVERRIIWEITVARNGLHGLLNRK